VPFAFFGHCWSALAAYEATVQLERAGRKPAHLFVSSQVAPQDGPVSRMLEMDQAELSVELEATIRDLGNTPHPELVAIYLKVLRDDVEVSRRYRVPHPVPLACPVTAFGWNADQEVRPEAMNGWTACGETRFATFPGRHHEFTEAPAALLNALCADLR
jgi:surfactin synthase thioesterase subunit